MPPDLDDTANRPEHGGGNGYTSRRAEWGDHEYVPLPDRPQSWWRKVMSTRPVRNIAEYTQAEKRPVPAWVPTAIIGLAMLLLTNIGLHIYWRGDTDRFIRDTEAFIRDTKTTNADVVKLKLQMETATKMASDLAAIKNWMIAVYERADANGWKLPPTPKEVRDVER